MSTRLSVNINSECAAALRDLSASRGETIKEMDVCGGCGAAVADEVVADLRKELAEALRVAYVRLCRLVQMIDKNEGQS